MTTIHNSDLFKELKEAGKLQQLQGFIPSQLAEKIVPVMEVNPKLLRRCNVAASSSSAISGGTTIYTTPSDRDFFLTSISLGVICTATCDVATGTIALFANVNGVQTNLIQLPIITLTAKDQVKTIIFNTPLKIDRGSVIRSNHTYTVGTMVRTYEITGYYIDNSSA